MTDTEILLVALAVVLVFIFKVWIITKFQEINMDYDFLMTASDLEVKQALSGLPEEELLEVMAVMDAYSDYLANIDQIVLH